MRVYRKYFPLLVAALSLAACGAESAAPSSETSADKAQTALHDHFIGRWQSAMPDAEGVIVNVPRASCDDPVMISSPKKDVILYASPKGGETQFELIAFNNRITWYPENAPTSIAEVKDADRFWLYSTNGLGKADWDNPMEYKRCK